MDEAILKKLMVAAEKEDGEDENGEEGQKGVAKAHVHEQPPLEEDLLQSTLWPEIRKL